MSHFKLYLTLSLTFFLTNVIGVGCSQNELSLLQSSTNSEADLSNPDLENPDTVSPPVPGTPREYPIPTNCQLPPSFEAGKKFYVDPVNGNMSNDGSFDHPWKTLAEVVNAGKIESMSYNLPYALGSSPVVAKNAGAPVKAGDSIFLRTGNHGVVHFLGYSNKNFISIKAQEGHSPRLERLYLEASAKFLIDGLTITPGVVNAGGNIVEVSDHGFHGPGSNIILANNKVYTTLNSGSYTAANWLSAASGMLSSSSCTTLVGNTITNVAIGMMAIMPNSTMHSNKIQNFSQDGMRIGGSNTSAINNQILDAKVSEADGDFNHDDGIQSFNLDPGSYDDMVIEGNTIIETTNPNNTFKAGIQGIGIFDGLYTRLRVVNNIVDVTLYHGIGILGAVDSLIAHNVVLGASTTWLALFDSKEGRPPTNTIVRNNISYKFIVPTSGADHNITMTNPADHFVKFNPTTKDYDFHLRSTSPAIHGGLPIPSVRTDLEGKARSTTAPSIGAYEY